MGMRCSTFSASLLAAGLALLLAGRAAAIPFFSIDFFSPTFPLVLESDSLAPGPIGGPPALAVPAAAMGLFGFGIDDLNAMTTGGYLGLTHFSVSRLSVGAATVLAPDVASEAAAGQQAGDIYVTGNITFPPRLFINSLAYNQDILGELPPFPPGVPVLPPIDNLDALDLAAPLPGFLALATGHPFVGASGLIGCGGDLFGPGPAPLMPFGALGLAFCADDVDALELEIPTGTFYFSLSPASPSLLPGSPIVGCAAGCGPADIFFAPAPYGVSFLLVGAPLLGLAPGDDVTALTFQPCLGFTALDADGDTIDDGCDNCLLVPNPSQTDVDVDGYGNQCDADYTNAGVVGIPAFNVLSAAWGSLIGAANYNPNVDHDESGSIGIPDFIVFSIQFGGVPGPSGLPCAGTVPCTH